MRKELGRRAAAIVGLAVGLSLVAACPASARNPYHDIARRLLERGLADRGAFSILQKILAAGPRLTGSPQAEAAVAAAFRLLQDMGFDNVHLEPVEVVRWVRGPKEEARLLSGTGGTIALDVCALGGSVGTPAAGLKARVLEVRSFEELGRAGDLAGGRIIFFNRPWDHSLQETFAAYGPMAQQRSRGAVEAARAGGVAALVRSASTSEDDLPHTGLMHYENGTPAVPAAALSPKSADRLSAALKLDPDALLELVQGSRTEGTVLSSNVVADITGTEKPEEVILLGGHLDSWDLGTGAHDDGAGCSQAVEALRLIRSLGLKPKRTLRAVLFMDEEFGGTGGRAYARSERRASERHLAAVESDRGGFIPLGIGLGDSRTFPRLAKWEPVLRSAGLGWLRAGGGGVDIGPLAESGTVLGGLVPDSQRYFDVHHGALDVIGAVNARELELGAVALAALAYVLAQEGI